MTARRGRPPVLSRDAVLQAAVAVIDDAGLAGCTMRAVAAHLGSSPMSVYRHVEDKDTLLSLVPDFLVGQVAAEVVAATEPVPTLRVLATGLAGVLDAHPAVAPLFARPAVGPHMQAAGERAIEVLVTAGWSPGAALLTLQAVVAQVIGEHVTRPLDDGDDHADMVEIGSQEHDVTWGVELLLAGIQQRIHQETP